MVEPLAENDQRDAIKALIQTYLSTFHELGVQTWLMHGSLLGWWWGKKIMPWDLDADVQISEADMYYLAAYHNMTTYYYKYEGAPEGRFYLLDLNPHYVHRGTDDVLNVIDARWVDTSTGLYIDITAARYNIDHPRGEGILYDKNGHEYRATADRTMTQDTYLYPLLETTFEGAPVNIPFSYKKMLESEYGKKALQNTHFHAHIFDEKRMEWIVDPTAATEEEKP
ncbi:LicD family [Geosmithia morbida]|uniref:LicD family n=1 Tax=Geosmithia morbida TaxID=1094350 RepID=A0A9P4YZY8_9HYPO|nr:LicD family [Geosmithia morbida]KAF4124884.1 LicD family [Geosmithia morbida]